MDRFADVMSFATVPATALVTDGLRWLPGSFAATVAFKT
jgi:hypothetical protein